MDKNNLKWTDEDLDNLLGLLARHTAIGKTTNEELSDAVLSEVWAFLPLSSRKELLINEMMDRFDKAYGIVRDSDGEIIQEPQSE